MSYRNAFENQKIIYIDILIRPAQSNIKHLSCIIQTTTYGVSSGALYDPIY